jgi:putative endopeptidase
LAAAKAWRVKVTNEKLLSSLKQDPHSPPLLRVNGPLSNMIGFYQTFNVTEGDAMFRKSEDRVLIW